MEDKQPGWVINILFEKPTRSYAPNGEEIFTTELRANSLMYEKRKDAVAAYDKFKRTWVAEFNTSVGKLALKLVSAELIDMEKVRKLEENEQRIREELEKEHSGSGNEETGNNDGQTDESEQSASEPEVLKQEDGSVSEESESGEE